MSADEHVSDAYKLSPADQLSSNPCDLPAGMVPWSGGDSAPADWDGGPVWLRCGEENVGEDWRHVLEDAPYDIIGYTPRKWAPHLDHAGEPMQPEQFREPPEHLVDVERSLDSGDGQTFSATTTCYACGRDREVSGALLTIIRDMLAGKAGARASARAALSQEPGK